MNLELAANFRGAIVKLIKKLRRESPTGLQLSQTERSTIALLQQRGSALPGELAAAEMITSQSMSQVLAHLGELKFITRTVAEDDKRKVNISLSETGLQMLQQLRNERDEWLAKAIEAVCTPEEQNNLEKVIPLLVRLVDYK